MNISLTNIRLFTALFSLILSIFAFYTDDIINSDGIKYIKMAEIFLESGFIESTKIMGWPFFSILIAYLHEVTSFSFELSAYILNSLLFVLITDSLILISNKILPNKHQLTFAALLIICFYSLNEYRDFIIRDIGYWAFCSLSLLQFIRFLETPSLKNSIFWQLSIILAILFRIEGLVILFGLPVYLLTFSPPFKALKQIVQLNLLPLISIIFVGLFTPGLSALIEINATERSYSGLIHLLKIFNSKTEFLGSQILNQYSEEYSALILSSGLFIMLIYKLTKGLSFGYLSLYFLSQWQKKSFQYPHRHLLSYFLVLNIIILIAFLFHGYFVVSRYLVMALLALLLLILPTICHKLEQAWIQKKYLFLGLASTILLVSLIDATTQSNSKSYIKDTAIWASKNLPKNKALLTTDKFTRYYFESHKIESNLTLTKNLNFYEKYDYLISVEKKHNDELQSILKTMNIEAIFSLKNKRGDQSIIYKIVRP